MIWKHQEQMSQKTYSGTVHLCPIISESSEEARWILDDQIRNQGQAGRILHALRLMLFPLGFQAVLADYIR